MAKYFRILIGCVAVWENQLLLTQRKKDAKYLPSQWQFVAGHVNFGEELVDAVKREMLEEVKLKIENPTLIGTSRWVHKDTHHLQVNYLVNLENKNAMITKEIQDLIWVPIGSPKINALLDDFNKTMYNQALSIESTEKGGLSS